VFKLNIPNNNILKNTVKIPLAGRIMHLHRKFFVSKIDIFQLFPQKLLHTEQ